MDFEGIRNFEAWRTLVRPLLSAGQRPLRMSPPLFRLLECIAHYRDAGRWELMYRLAWRSVHENPRLLEDHADLDVRRASLMERAIERDVHKMHAFVRFRETEQDGERRYFAWFEPEHEILPRAIPFFCKRFPNMSWMIATPDGAAVWQDRALELVDTPDRSTLPRADAYEDLWRTYYRSICNVSRVNPAAMRREMPQKYWRNLPESSEIPLLMREGMARFAEQEHQISDANLKSARAISQALAELPTYAEGISACRRCELWKHATQAVEGEGPSDATIMLVGEQPGDEEDLRGRPFVGPAGKVLDGALQAAGLDRRALYVTNAVKHFKWEPRGKRRLHRKPDTREIGACNGWLRGEIERVAPRVIVALGATAIRAVLGTSATIEDLRERVLRYGDDARVFCTYHPSAVLRAVGERATVLQQSLEEDLRRARVAAG
jgi:DNA polymerase